MVINNVPLSIYNFPQIAKPQPEPSVSIPSQQNNNYSIYANSALQFTTPGTMVNISPEAMNAYKKTQGHYASTGIREADAVQDVDGCQSCRSRKYVDRSSDPSVSFQAPAHISPGQAASVVMAHEREHINNDRAKAERDDRRVISQTVSLSMSTCPECGRMYVSGGTARTVTAGKNSDGNTAQDSQPEPNAGKLS